MCGEKHRLDRGLQWVPVINVRSSLDEPGYLKYEPFFSVFFLNFLGRFGFL